MLSKDLKESCGPNGYRWILCKGNNHGIVSRVMDNRPAWTKIDSTKSSLFDFKWTPYSSNIRFDFLGKHGEKNLVNHFEFHGSITQKDQLFLNLQKACDNSHRDVFEILPVTFVIDYAEQHVFNVMMDRFQIYFNVIDKNKALGTQAINAALAAHPNLKAKSGYSKHNFALKESMNAG